MTLSYWLLSHVVSLVWLLSVRCCVWWMFPPVQLHLNSWAFLPTFQIMCKRLSIKPTVDKFTYFYQLKMGAKMGWPSLNSYKYGKLFQLYTQSWKNFKSNFFWVQPNLACGDSREFFFKEDEETPKIPILLATFPIKVQISSPPNIVVEEIRHVEIIGK